MLFGYSRHIAVRDDVPLYAWNAIAGLQARYRRGQRLQCCPWKRVLCTTIQDVCTLVLSCGVCSVTNKRVPMDCCFSSRPFGYDLLHKCTLHERLMGFKLQGREGKAPDVLRSLHCAVSNICCVCVSLSQSPSQTAV